MAVLMRALARTAGAVLLMAGLTSASAQESLEYAVKAAYLAKFVPFIDWPASAFASPGAPLNICILGPDPFGGALDRAAAAEQGPRPLAVRRLSSPELAGACQILYLANADAAASLPPGLRALPIVTVTESGQGDGIISFVIDANHVRFDINDDDAARSGLKISSKLLSLAHAVKHRSGP